MSKFQGLFRKNYHCHSSNQKDKSHKFHCYLRPNILICVFIFLFIAAYLFQVNSLTNLGFKTNELEAKVSELESVASKLELEAARLQSITKIREESVKLGFIPVDKVEYIKDNDVSIAVVK